MVDRAPAAPSLALGLAPALENQGDIQRRHKDSNFPQGAGTRSNVATLLNLPSF